MVAKTILIADGGSTKTDWSIVSGNWEIDRIRTGGINPFFQTEEEISAEIRDNLIPRIRESDSVGAVYFYGAGCAIPEKNENKTTVHESCPRVDLQDNQSCGKS